MVSEASVNISGLRDKSYVAIQGYKLAGVWHGYCDAQAADGTRDITVLESVTRDGNAITLKGTSPSGDAVATVVLDATNQVSFAGAHVQIELGPLVGLCRILGV